MSSNESNKKKLVLLLGLILCSVLLAGAYIFEDNILFETVRTVKHEGIVFDSRSPDPEISAVRRLFEMYKTEAKERDGQVLSDNPQSFLSGLAAQGSYRLFRLRQRSPVDLIRGPVIKTLMAPPCIVPFKEFRKLLFCMGD